MDNNTLYNNIYQAKIKESIYIITQLILEDKNGKNIEYIENTFIALCGYIGSYITLVDIRLWIDVVEETYDMINSDKIVIKNIYILVTKLCIVCDIYIKNPKTKSGILNLPKLREKIIYLFDNKAELNYEVITKFDNVLPPSDSETYNLAKLAISGILKNLSKIEYIDYSDDTDELLEISNKTRDIFDYLSRKNYKFETKFYHSDNDSIWFLWGIINIMCNDEISNKCFNLFMYNFVKKMKTERIGLLWGMSIVLIYLNKKTVARVWNENEIILIKKINEVGMDMYKQIKKELYKNADSEETKNNYNNSIDGLDVLSNYVPIIKETAYIENTYLKDDSDIETKKIKYSKK